MRDEGAAMSHKTVAILDGERLDRRTMGSEALRVEILSLFVAEIERLLGQVAQARDPQTRSARLHAMGGLARSVGALRLEEAVRIADLGAEVSDADLEPLGDAVSEVVAVIRAGGP